MGRMILDGTRREKSFWVGHRLARFSFTPILEEPIN